MDSLLADAHIPQSKEIQIISTERNNAIRNSDYQTLDVLDNNIKVDFGPVQSNIHDHGEQAFNRFTDVNGRQLYICGNKNAAIWSHVKEDEEAKKAASPETKEHTAFNATVEVGAMSKNGGVTVVSTSWLLDHIDDITIAALATGIASVVGYKIASALARNAAEAVDIAANIAAVGAARASAYEALEIAHQTGNPVQINAAIAQLKHARAQVDEIWLTDLPKGTIFGDIISVATKYPKIATFMGSTIVAIVSTIAMEYIWNLINKDYFIKVQVYNYDKFDWKIDEWYHDNGIIAGGSVWETKTIAAATQDSVLPWGPLKADWVAVNSVTYCFQNSFTVMDGVGIALRAARTDSKAGFAMAYLCKFWSSNRLTVKPEYPPSIKDFYDNEKNWPSDLPSIVTCEVKSQDGTSIVIKGSTNALKGVANNIYTFDVLIGAPQT